MIDRHLKTVNINPLCFRWLIKILLMILTHYFLLYFVIDCSH